MAEIKRTKRTNYEDIIEIASELGRVDLVEFAKHEIELLDKKKSSDVKSKNQIANEGIKEIIVNTLQELGKFATISEIQSANAELSELSNQKISALLKQLVDSEVVKKQIDKKKAYFAC
jgi:hypothetical protein